MIVKERDPRVTALGRFLRCGIDELPQLWNIVKGQMAWAGPRPDPDWMLPHYGQTCCKRSQALPGITGFAQILNSRFLSTAEAFALDIWYICHRTWMLDAYIILATPLYMAGWHSIGRKRLQNLRTLPDTGIPETSFQVQQRTHLLRRDSSCISLFTNHVASQHRPAERSLNSAPLIPRSQLAC
jgi:Bacterial sugar transferase